MSDGSLSQRADVIDDEEGSGEDLFGDNHADDYRDMGVLDQYDSQMLDDRDVVKIWISWSDPVFDRGEGRRVFIVTAEEYRSRISALFCIRFVRIQL